MIYPTIDELSGGKLNRYEVVVGVAKCARIVTDDYVEMKAKAQKMIENHETDKSVAALIDPVYRDQKAVKIALGKILDGDFEMHRPANE